MTSFKETHLWKSAFGDQNEQCRRLEHAFDSFRDRVQMLANEIFQDQPTFTVHDISHIDALWRMGSLITGGHFKLTPTEGFVLGGAFLVHDLAMTLSAYPEGIEDLKRLPQWQDTLFSILRRKNGCEYTEIDIKDINLEIEEEAKRILLRDLHAIKAQELCNEKWTINNNEYYLIDKPELRETFGRTIGEIAASHWWSAEDIKKKFVYNLGAPSNLPTTWTVDKLKIACILRLSDYCQIDDTRAPSFLMALRKPDGIAKQHWGFQNKLLQPFIEANKLVYTSKYAFKKEESVSWWLCFDTLKSIDTEIRNTNNVVREAHKDFTFQIEGINGVESPERLADKIQTDKWLPIDATIHVTNVAHLAKTLGGRRLYGNDKTVPFRELIQNSADAVRARRIFEGKAATWGDIIIRHGKSDKNHWIEVEDNGIGMSEEVLKGPFLDFGTSYWGSELMLREFPGLIGKGFSATGRYGIGFFSVFMICTKVEVISLRAGQARSETLVLEFGEGLEARPILRHAENNEFLDNGGTRIKLWLKPDVVQSDGTFDIERTEKPIKLNRLIEWLCPSLDVNISYENGNKLVSIIRANDWMTIPGKKLLKRISLDHDRYGSYRSPERLESELKNLRLLKNGENVVGRGCILNARPRNRKVPEEGIITIGGFRANTLRDYEDYTFFGILSGKPNSAVRNLGTPIVKEAELSKWATEQGKIWVALADSDSRYNDDPTKTICKFGGNPLDKSLGTFSGGKLSLDIIAKWEPFPNELLLVDYNYTYQNQKETITLSENVLVFPKSHFSDSFVEIDDYSNRMSWPLFPKIKITPEIQIAQNSIYYWVLSAIAAKWKVEIMDLASHSNFSEEDYVLGSVGSNLLTMKATKLKNPGMK